MASATIEEIRLEMAQEGIDWGALVGGAAGAKALDVLWNFFKIKRESRSIASKNIDNTVAIYTALQSIPTHQCKRRIVFKAHNGGKAIDSRTQTRVSIMYEDFHDPFTSVIDEVQGWRMDESYARMVNKLCKEKFLILSTEEMEKGRLKDLYESSGVKFSCLHYLGEDAKSIYFSSFASHTQIPEYDAYTRSRIDAAVDRIIKHLNF
jgi:hypothetical protein